jgi:hypothetical protein
MKKYLLIIAVIIFTACESIPDYDDLSSEFVVSTNLDDNAVFSDYKTFYISDTVVNLGGEDADSLWIDDDAKQLVKRVKDNMAARGYTYVQRHQHPDLGMQMGAVNVLNINIYPGWWGGYPGWGWYPWGYYPYYYPWTTVYTYNTGTIILDTYDVKNADDTGTYRAVWNITSFGALGSDSVNLQRGENSIDQGFEQSPYIQAN